MVFLFENETRNSKLVLPQVLGFVLILMNYKKINIRTRKKGKKPYSRAQ